MKTEFKLLEHIHMHQGLIKQRKTKTMAGKNETYGMYTY